MRLTLSTEDLAAFIRSRPRLLVGAGELTRSPFAEPRPVEGSVNQLIDVPGEPRRKTMPYRLKLDDGQGRELVLSATKFVNPPFRRSWKDTTTLYVLLLEGDTTIGAGIMKISFPAFLRQFTTYSCSGGTILHRLVAPVRFYLAFLGRLWEVYGVRLRRLV
jgi:hypothetical protein